METYSLIVMAADKTFFDGHCASLIIPSLDGLVGIQAHHENMVIAVKEGEIRIKLEDGTEIEALVGIGFFKIINNRATLLVQTVERPEDIDIARAREAEERAMENLRQKQSLREYYHTQAALSRAMSRLKTVDKHKY
ncbi:ATP synthase F1 subunit epsilon [Kineothrix sedimenti]|uniref:ATP synthase epsilon chain n=1 Tax=Kineothrix sedimenti TaxID=3123317 RepID=A0ABZ3EWP7_9FIRM